MKQLRDLLYKYNNSSIIKMIYEIEGNYNSKYINMYKKSLEELKSISIYKDPKIVLKINIIYDFYDELKLLKKLFPDKKNYEIYTIEELNILKKNNVSINKDRVGYKITGYKIQKGKVDYSTPINLNLYNSDEWKSFYLLDSDINLLGELVCLALCIDKYTFFSFTNKNKEKLNKVIEVIFNNNINRLEDENKNYNLNIENKGKVIYLNRVTKE